MLARTRFAVQAAALLLCVATVSCSGHNRQIPGSRADVQGLTGLPAPSQLLRGLSDLDPGRIRTGSDHMAGQALNTSVPGGTSLMFSPTWDAGNQLITDTAYAIYQFDLSAYTGDPELHSGWTTPPATGQAWIGFGNFTRDAWDWSPLPATGPADYTPAAHVDGSGAFLVAVLMLDGATPVLDYLRAGGNAEPLAVLTADPRNGPAPVNAMLDASGSSDLDGTITKYEFDVLGNGTWADNGPDPTYDHTYSTIGLYHAKVRVTDNGGAQSIASVDVGPGWQHTWGGASFDDGAFICASELGPVFVAGTTNSFGLGNDETVVVKYSAAGTVIWQKTIGTANGDRIGDMVMDSNENIFLTIDYYNPVTEDYEPAVISLSTDGAVHWQKRWPGPGYVGGGTLTHVDAISNDYVYAAWTYHPPASDAVILVIKLTASTGAKTWTSILGQTGIRLSVAKVGASPLIIEEDGVFLWGTVHDDSAPEDVSILHLTKLNADGSAGTARTFSVVADDYARYMSIAPGGVLFCTSDNFTWSFADPFVFNWCRGHNGAGDARFSTLHYNPVELGGGCFALVSFKNPGFLDGQLLRFNGMGEIVQQRGLGAADVHDNLYGIDVMIDSSSLPNTPVLLLAGRAEDNTGVWFETNVTTTIPEVTTGTLALNQVFETTALADMTFTVNDVAPGSEVIDTGGGSADMFVSLYYP